MATIKPGLDPGTGVGAVKPPAPKPATVPVPKPPTSTTPQWDVDAVKQKLGEVLGGALRATTPTPSVPSTPTVPTTPVQTSSAAVNNSAPSPSVPSYQAPAPFQFNYNNMSFDQAKNQAEQRFNPLYEQAVKNIQAQQYQNEMDSGEVAANRGIAQSGLAADALNKIKIASQGQIAQANTERMSQVAALAQQMTERDQDRGDRLRQQAYSEYSDGRNFGYNQHRDQVNDDWRNNQFDYQKSLDSWNQNFQTDRAERSDYESDRGFDYQVGRDKVTDTRYKNEWDYNVGRDKIADGRYNQEWNYNVGRDKIEDQRYTDETKYNRGQDQKQWDYQAGRDKVSDSQWNQTYNRGVLESDRSYNRGVFESNRSHTASQQKKTEEASQPAKPKSQTNSYNDGITYWAGMKDDVKKHGAYRIEKQILSNPEAIQEIRNQGYDINSYIDSLYYVATDGKYKSKQAYEDYVKSLTEDW
jgi:hypothetical protein